jgi:hypothetical protein
VGENIAGPLAELSRPSRYRVERQCGPDVTDYLYQDQVIPVDQFLVRLVTEDRLDVPRW